MRLDKIVKKKMRTRNKLKKSNTNNRLRLTVNRSSKNISAQIIDDINNKTLVAASSVEKDIKKINKAKKSDLSLFVGETLAKRANKKNITNCYSKRFAAKEALSKALGTGIRKGINFKDIEILNDNFGKPSIYLKGSTANFLRKKIQNTSPTFIF